MLRKIREVLLAVELERNFSKEEILQFYLNQIYFGHGAYGVQAAAKITGTTVPSFDARTPREIESAFSQMARQRAGALLVLGDPLYNQQTRQIVELATKNRLPSSAALWEYAETGGLMSYQANIADQFVRAATYVDKILKGAKPGDLPVEQPTKFELVINLKTAKALGITIPQSVLARADEVIQ